MFSQERHVQKEKLIQKPLAVSFLQLILTKIGEQSLFSLLNCSFELFPIIGFSKATLLCGGDKKCSNFLENILGISIDEIGLAVTI